MDDVDEVLAEAEAIIAQGYQQDPGPRCEEADAPPRAESRVVPPAYMCQHCKTSIAHMLFDVGFIALASFGILWRWGGDPVSTVIAIAVISLALGDVAMILLFLWLPGEGNA